MSQALEDLARDGQLDAVAARIEELEAAYARLRRAVEEFVAVSRAAST